VPAVLDRPRPLLIQLPRPTNRGQMPRLLSLDLALAANPAGALVDRRERVRALVRVRPDHDHMHRPFVWLTTDEAGLGGQLSLGANATLLICAGRVCQLLAI
jgi:hypothetical protein